jgi:hypothetical protein
LTATCREIGWQYVVFTEIQATLELPAAMSWSSIVTIDIRPEEDPQCRFEGHHGPESGAGHATQCTPLRRTAGTGNSSASPDRISGDAESVLAAGLLDADDSCRHCGDRDGEDQSSAAAAKRSPTR